MRNLASGFVRHNTGFQWENLVFVELLRRGYRVSVGSSDVGEVDFVARKNTEQIYIQVTESMLDLSVKDRELKPLRSVRDAYPKVVISANVLDAGVLEDGIDVIYVADWLLGY